MTEGNFAETEGNNSPELKIASTKDLMLAIKEGRLAEAETYLLAEKEKPSIADHDGLWLQNNLAALAHGYLTSGDQAGLSRINALLPQNFQVKNRE